MLLITQSIPFVLVSITLLLPVIINSPKSFDSPTCSSRQYSLLFKLKILFFFFNVNYIVDKALSLVDKKVDVDTFIYEMEHMNK